MYTGTAVFDLLLPGVLFAEAKRSYVRPIYRGSAEYEVAVAEVPADLHGRTEIGVAMVAADVTSAARGL